MRAMPMTKNQIDQIKSTLDADENIQAMRRMIRACQDRLKELTSSDASEGMIHYELRNLTALNVARDALAQRILRQKGILDA